MDGEGIDWGGDSSSSEVDPRSYRRLTLRNLANICKRAYDKQTFSDKRTGSEALVEDHGDIRVIAFRGTQAGSMRDYWADMKMLPSVTALHHGLVHSGGWRRSGAMFRKTLAQVESAKSRVIFIGHSLGGIEAIAMMLRFSGLPIRPDEVVVFGTPPCVRLWEQPQMPVISVENYRDPICLARPYNIYEPIGDLLWLDAMGAGRSEKPDNIKNFTLLSTFVKYGVRNMGYHSIAQYAHKL